MADAIRCDEGDWVEVEYVLLAASERAAGIPDDTAAQPLRAWVKGFALGSALIGDEVSIETMAGRVVRGHLSVVEPGYTHTFGSPPPEIVAIGRDLRARVAAYRSAGAPAALDAAALDAALSEDADPEAGE